MKMKINNSICGFICFFVVFICCSCKYNIKKSNNVRNLEEQILYIQFVDFEILTTVNVPCKQFESYFSEDIIKKKDIRDQFIITEFNEIIKDLVIYDSICKNNIDTRAIIKFINHTDTTIICMDGFLLRKGDVSYYTPQKLIDFIESL